MLLLGRYENSIQIILRRYNYSLTIMQNLESAMFFSQTDLKVPSHYISTINEVTTFIRRKLVRPTSGFTQRRTMPHNKR